MERDGKHPCQGQFLTTMCGIIGFVGANHQHNRDLIKALFLQLSLRGTHATGYASTNDLGVLHLVSAPGNAENFVNNRLKFLSGDNIKLVGHTRYSTSDLQWNQPLENDSRAIVMNGVISQEHPTYWPKPTDSTEYVTGNDAEVALRYAEAGLRGDMAGSWAICELEAEGNLHVYRNGFRPLWWGLGDDFVVASSTADSLLRCGVTRIEQVSPGCVFKLEDNYTVSLVDCFQQSSDLQPQLNNLFPDLQCHV